MWPQLFELHRSFDIAQTLNLSQPKSVIWSFGLNFYVIMQIVINETCHPTGKSTFDIILFEDVEVLRIAASFEGEMEDFISEISTVVNVNAETFDTNCK